MTSFPREPSSLGPNAIDPPFTRPGEDERSGDAQAAARDPVGGLAPVGRRHIPGVALNRTVIVAIT
jgi:hypothetical protein